MSDIDVLIIGGGPTGLTAALELAAQKVPFRIIDKATQRSSYSRALVLQPRSQELLNRHGDVRELLDAGFQAVGTTTAVNGKKVVDVNVDFVGITPTVFPAPRSISQADTEAWLDRILAKHGAAVEMGVEAKSIEQDDEGVTVRLVSQSGAEETVRAKYVVGADGAHSCVRHSAKTMTFDGDAYPQEFVLADTHIKTNLPVNRAYFCLGTGVCVVLPMKGGMVRLVVSRPNQPKTGVPQLEEFESFMKRVFPGEVKLYNPTWLTRFNLHHRGVNKYREGRLFVAGDAAHIHSPAGGQGMNTGIQDAINLGWKLAAVLRGEKPDSFLDTYDDERRPVGQHLLKTTDKLFSWITWTNPIYLFLRNLILPWTMPLMTRNPEKNLQAFKFMTEFGIRYSRSPIVGTAPGFRGPILGGNRAVDGKLDGPEGEKYLQTLFTPESHHLVLFSGVNTAAASEGDLHRAETRFLEACRTQTKVHTIFGPSQAGKSGYVDIDGAVHKSYGFEGSGYALVRPDGYVAHIGPLSAFDGLLEWIQ
ncbi:hypothetical protein JX265_007733 [Neoarthrinium moseri]|uniref:FAD-binding domain-containing protein n=1 Tax=Neoarthrinium moseri TaxID=1658444 RepID=A0A9P9WJC7_9PEZI|nr:hypothetical protein JX265_007733 [Neoarthrinium moseri]